MTLLTKHVVVYHMIPGVGCYKVARVPVGRKIDDLDAVKLAHVATVSGDGMKWWNNPNLNCIPNCRNTTFGDYFAIIKTDHSTTWYKILVDGSYSTIEGYPQMIAPI